MKFCPFCGQQIPDEANVCPYCQNVVAPAPVNNQVVNHGTDGLAVAAKVLLIIGCVVGGFAIIPLAWCLPITITICGKLKRGEPIGTGLKVCSLLFVNMIAGILLLCRNDG